MKVRQFQERCAQWATSFWPDRTSEVYLIKAMEELGEVAETFVKPHKRKKRGEEWADVFIIIMTAAWLDGYDMQIEAEKKLSKNERTKVSVVPDDIREQLEEFMEPEQVSAWWTSNIGGVSPQLVWKADPERVLRIIDAYRSGAYL